MADSNRTGLAYVEEAAWGVNPGTALQDVNFTSESLTYAIDNITSDTIRTDRQTADLIQTGASTSGDISFELQYGGHDPLMQGALWAAQWVGADDGATDAIIISGDAAGNLEFDLNAAGNTITLGSSVTHSLVTDQWIKLTGSTTDDGYHLLTDVTGNVLTVASITTTETLEAADAAEIESSRIRNGTTENSYWVERAHADITQFFQFAGSVVNTFSMTFSANAIATGTFGFIGKAATLTQATSGTGTNTAAATTSMMNAVANVGNILINGTAPATCLIQEIGFNLNNNVRGLSSIGTLGFCDIGVGEVAIDGTLNMYFQDETYYDLYLAGTAFSLSWQLTDAAGNSYIFQLPNCKFISDAVNAGGKNSDIMENTTFQAVMDATDLYSIQICRFAS